MNEHIQLAINQAKKEGNKGVIGFTGSHDENNKYNKLLSEGKLEVFEQRYNRHNGYFTCLLMRKPKPN